MSVQHRLRDRRGVDTGARMAQESPEQTLQATGLVHEAYLRLVEAPGGQRWNNRGHFFAAAAKAMRRILVDQARRKCGPRMGGTHQVVARFEAERQALAMMNHPAGGSA